MKPPLSEKMEKQWQIEIEMARVQKEYEANAKSLKFWLRIGEVRLGLQSLDTRYQFLWAHFRVLFTTIEAAEIVSFLLNRNLQLTAFLDLWATRRNFKDFRSILSLLDILDFNLANPNVDPAKN
jgi:hypothetical protein